MSVLLFLRIFAFYMLNKKSCMSFFPVLKKSILYQLPVVDNIHTHVHTHTHMNTHTHIHTHTQRHTHAHAHEHTHTHTHTHMHMNIHTHILTHTHMHTHAHIYMCHSVNKVKVNFTKRFWQLEALFIVAPFSRKSVMMCPFISQKNVSMTFFIDDYTRNFTFTWEQMYFNSMGCPYNSVVPHMVYTSQLPKI